MASNFCPSFIESHLYVLEFNTIKIYQVQIFGTFDGSNFSQVFIHPPPLKCLFKNNAVRTRAIKGGGCPGLNNYFLYFLYYNVTEYMNVKRDTLNNW